MAEAMVAIKAGAEAYARIQREGLHPGMISGVASAAGGPKWFTVYGLSRYLLGDFLQGASQHLHFIGSSVGSWQMTAGLTSDPAAAIDRLREAYAGYIYEEDPSPDSIARACQHIISTMLGDEASQVLHHDDRTLHVITSRGKGWLGHESKVRKSIGFGYSFLLNALSRRHMDKTSVRTIFSSGANLPFDHIEDVLATHRVNLTDDNLLPALLGSGSIPYVSPGVRDIPGAPQGTYWDGGLTDYHISLPYHTDGLILHPHFFPHVYAGWFDKKLPWGRTATDTNMSKAILIYPTQAFIETLPDKQISDMQDFYRYGQDQQGRCDYWRAISDRSVMLGDELAALITAGDIMSIVRPYVA